MEHVILDVSTNTMVTTALTHATTIVPKTFVMMGLKDAVLNADLDMQKFKDASKYCAHILLLFKQGRQLLLPHIAFLYIKSV